MVYLFSSAIEYASSPELSLVIQSSTLVFISLIFLSVFLRGTIPMMICFLGIALIGGAITLPLYSDRAVGGDGGVQAPVTKQSMEMTARMYFSLGLAMIVFGMIIGYRPSILFTRNRPQSLESVWAKYPVWNDNVKLVGNFTEPSVPVVSLMKDDEKFLMWRYEYVLAEIYGSHHLVSPGGLVPKSTRLLRELPSRTIMGKPKYSGFFM